MLIMDLFKLGTQLISSQLGNSANSDAIGSILGNLLQGDSGNSSGLGNIISAMQDKGMGSIADSWLGDGSNEEISADQVRELVGSNKISSMASELNTDEGSLLNGLKDALPQILDQSSSGGSLMDNISGLGSLLSKFKSPF